VGTEIQEKMPTVDHEKKLKKEKKRLKESEISAENKDIFRELDR